MVKAKQTFDHRSKLGPRRNRGLRRGATRRGRKPLGLNEAIVAQDLSHLHVIQLILLIKLQI
jgi:hypothetical protein